jgi:hypothetical protein
MQVDGPRDCVCGNGSRGDGDFGPGAGGEVVTVAHRLFSNVDERSNDG